MAGLLDFLNTDQGRMGLGLLAAAGPRSDGAGFGQRMAEGMGSFDAYKQNQLKTQFADMQLQQARAEMEAAKALLAANNRKREALPSLFAGGRAALSPLAGNPELGILPSQGRAAMPSRIDVQRGLEAGYTPDELHKLDGLRNVGMDEVARTVKGMQGGREVEQQFDKFGRPVGQGMEQFRAPVEMALGNQKQLLDPFTLKPKASFAMGQSPDSVASNALTMRGQNMTDSRARDRLDFDRMGGAAAGDGGTSQMGLNKLFGKPQAGYRWKPDGALEFIPGGPADQKAQAQKGGEGTVGGVVADLRDKYSQLDQENGIVSTNNRIGTNLGAAFGASGLGQTLNGMVGTKTQSARDSIAMTRPLLLQSIMKATGMSAKQMDSNAELKLYLATATDPQKGLEANLEALDRIEALYGGGGRQAQPDAVRPAQAGGGWGIERAQ